MLSIPATKMRKGLMLSVNHLNGAGCFYITLT